MYDSFFRSEKEKGRITRAQNLKKRLEGNFMAKNKIRKLLISAMATALLGTLTIGVSSISAYAEESVANYFMTMGGSYTLTNPTTAFQGVTLNVKPTESNGTVDLTFNGAGKLWAKNTTWVGGAFHYKMADPTAVDAVMVTYRSTADQDYSISFITTADGTYVSLTDDVTFQGNVPYANGSIVPMSLDFTSDNATLEDMIIDFKPTVGPMQTRSLEYSTVEMFKGGLNYRDFSLTNTAVLTAETGAAGKYAERYTEEWVHQLLEDMYSGYAILEFSFVGVKDVTEGASIGIWTMNGFDYQAFGTSGFNAETGAIQRQAFDWEPLFVQKSKDIKFDVTNSNATNGIDQLWEAWVCNTETGRIAVKDATDRSGTPQMTSQIYVYDEPSMNSSLGSSTVGNNLIYLGYHIMRPGLIKKPVVYYKNTNLTFAGRFNILSALDVTTGSTTETYYVPAWTDWTLADLGLNGCTTGATWTGSTGLYASNKEFTAKETINVREYLKQSITVTLGEHNSTMGTEILPTCTQPGYAASEECSICGKVLTKGAFVPALGHEFGEVTYEWSEDHSTCTATVVCERDETHVATETRWTNYTVTQNKDCTNDELSTYTATFLDKVFGTASEENIKTADADKNMHIYGEVTYTWSADNTKCTASRVCLTDETHIDRETVVAFKTVTQEATATQVEISTMTANFKDSAFESQTKENVQTGDKLEDTTSSDTSSESSTENSEDSTSGGCSGSIASLGCIGVVVAMVTVVVSVKRKKED